MEAMQKIRRHGRHMTRLAIAALVGALLYAGWLAFVPWLPATMQDPSILARYYELQVAEPQALPASIKGILSLSGLLRGLSAMLPLWMLYRLGTRLQRDNALNPETAVAVRHLAHSIVASAVLLQLMAGLLMGVADSALYYTVEGARMVPFSTSGAKVFQDVGELFLLVFACLCLYSLAWLIQAGAEAADDARSIV